METLTEPVKKCVALLRGAQSDTEKIAGLFMITQVIRAGDCPPKCKKVLFDAIGSQFLKRLIVAHGADELYPSVALAILSNCCCDPEFCKDPETLTFVPIFLNLLNKANCEDSDDSLILVTETYECLQRIAATDEGQKALLDGKAVSIMSEIYSQQSFQTDSALKIIVTLVSKFGRAAWEDISMEAFHGLMNKICTDFETEKTERKFELCDILCVILGNSKEKAGLNAEGELWPSTTLKALMELLRSRGSEVRNQALKLTSIMIETLKMDWAIRCVDELADLNLPANPNGKNVFFLLVVQLASVELRMQLEDRTLDQALKNGDLVCACLLIVENAVAFISQSEVLFSDKEKAQLYNCLKNCFLAVVGQLRQAQESTQNGKVLNDKEKLFLCAMVRALSAWLGQDPAGIKDVVCDVLPIVLKLANENFQEFLKQQESNPSDGSLPSLLTLLLPGIGHLTIEPKSRKIMLECNECKMLLDVFRYHWSLLAAKKKSGQNRKVPSTTEICYALVSLSNTFMNMSLLEAEMTSTSPIFVSLLKLVFTILPEIENDGETLILHGNVTVLGLFLLKQQSRIVDKNDFALCRFIQSAIKFLWDAHTLERRPYQKILDISTTYKSEWFSVSELWFLGMQTMCGVLKEIPWISEFAVESGWVEGIIEGMKADPHSKGLQVEPKSAFEDLLCTLVDANPALGESIKKTEGKDFCRSCRLKQLSKRLFPAIVPEPDPEPENE